MRNLRGYQYSCSFAVKRQDVPFLFDAVSGPVSEGLRPVKAFGYLVRVSRPDALLQKTAYEECGPYTPEVSSLTKPTFPLEERINLW